MRISARTVVAGVTGDPIDQSLSPLIHNAWIEAAALDAIYVALKPGGGDFTSLALAFRGGVIRGLNVTAPFKERALAIADIASNRARRAGAANLLVFEAAGEIWADNTDGEGLLTALKQGASGFDPATGPVVILGAGGAARGAAAAFLDAGAPAVRLINRDGVRARALAADLGGPISVVAAGDMAAALVDAQLVVNATPAAPEMSFEAVPASAVIADMVYRPAVTPFLAHAATRGLATVDGLAMLIGQARPSFKALFGEEPPELDVRSLAIKAMLAP